MEIHRQSVVILPSKKLKNNPNFEAFQKFFADQSNRDKAWTWSKMEWDINNPEESASTLKDKVSRNASVLVTMPRAHKKGIETAANVGKKHGLVPRIIEQDEAVSNLKIIPMPFDRSDVTDGIDFIGDLHGCAQEFLLLLDRLGYLESGWSMGKAKNYLPYLRKHPEGRKTLLLGDLTDRGPHNLACLLIARQLDELGMLRVLGNHDEKCARVLLGANINLPKGLQKTMSEMKGLKSREWSELGNWLGDAQTQLVLDEGRIVAAHAGIDAANQGRNTRGSRSFALYGPGTNDGRKDEDGYPIRLDWALDYESDVVVVHGHVVHKEVREINNVVSIDTGCVFGGKLTAYRWPQKEIVQVDALKTYWGEKRFE